MCGIVGDVGNRVASASSVDDALAAMLGAIVHRGPDEQRSERLGEAVLGTARLALVDKPTSAQPMLDATSRHLLAFNGEIYNYLELRRELEGMGVEFRTSGDTEVVLYALIHWGVDALPRFRGQFAIAYWSLDSRTLLLARDRFGIVPLFWTAPTSERLVFASEVKAIAAAGLPARISPLDIVESVTLWGLHPGRSVFDGVNSVEPGGYVRWQGRTGAATGRYWEFDFADERDPRGLDEQADDLKLLLAQAVERRVPQYGDPAVLLSGGLDSSAVLALLRELTPESRINSYSIQFVQNALNESPFQFMASQAFATIHRSILCDDTTVANSLVETVRHTEIPLVRTAPAASISLAATIESEGTRAVLSGEGADELFCGYDLFKIAAIRDSWAADPTSPDMLAMLESVLQQQKDLGRAVERAFYEQGVDQRDDPLFSHLNRWTSAFRVTQYLTGDVRRRVSLEDIFGRARAALPPRYREWSAVEQAQYLEVKYFLASTLLGSQCDRPYMAHSIEARYPFLDEDVADFALTLPQDSKLHGLSEKRILKAAVGSSLPAAIVERVKQPYTAPEGDVFRSAAGNILLDEYVSPSAIAATGLFDAKRVGWLLGKLKRSHTSFHDDLAVLWILTTQILAGTYGVADL